MVTAGESQVSGIACFDALQIHADRLQELRRHDAIRQVNATSQGSLGALS